MPDRPLLSIDEARATVLAHVNHRTETQEIAVEDALDRVLAAAVHAAGDTPPFPSSAMDGYALVEADISEPRTLSVVGESRAGAPYTGRLQAGQAIRISTGAAVPGEAAAVIRQEDVIGGEGTIDTRTAVEAGANIRGAGEDMRRGSLVLAPGTRLGPAELGAAIAAGSAILTVARRPAVAVLSTGDELRAPGEPLGAGQIHNSNGPMLMALATRAGAAARALASLPDDREETERRLGAALAGADVLIVSGGVSVGPHDHVKPALAALGVTERFWGVALQPGKPTWFGTREEKLVFALPGNPVSAAVTFTLFARPALEALTGAAPSAPPVAEAVLTTAVRRNPYREQAIRVVLRSGEAGQLTATPTGAQDSHLFSSLLLADALAIIPAGSGPPLPAGARVRLLPRPG